MKIMEKQIQEQKDFVQERLGMKRIEKDRKYVNEILQKVIVHVELDPDLLEKIDQEAAKDLRTRKAQVMYIIKDHFNKQEVK